MLAHKAEEEGIAVAEIIAGQAGHVNYDIFQELFIPRQRLPLWGKTEEVFKDE